MVKREMWGPEEWGGHPTWTSLITSDESSPSIFVGFYYDELMMTLLRARSFFPPSTSMGEIEDLVTTNRLLENPSDD